MIPGTIEFEDYDAGGEGKAYHETTPANEGEATYRQDAVDIEENDGAGGLVVGYCRPSEWLQYTVNVTTAGTYDVYFKVASEKSGTSFKLAVDGTEKGTVSVPNTGSWNTFNEVKTQVTLTAGKHVLRVTMPTGYHNLDSMRFLPAGTTPATHHRHRSSARRHRHDRPRRAGCHPGPHRGRELQHRRRERRLP